MKLSALILGLAICLCGGNALARDAGIRFIKTRGMIRCGTDLSSRAFAYKDKDGFWQGFDADLCRAFAAATLGDADKFEMIHVEGTNISKALATNKIDIMFGNTPATARQEILSQATPAEVIYYDKQMFLAKNKAGATSMEDYRGATVCAVSGSDDLFNVMAFSDKYNLNLKTILFAGPQRAKEAFLLKRCDLLTGNERYLRGIKQALLVNSPDISLLPEILTVRPIYAQVQKENNSWRITAKWIINALTLAEAQEITSKNVDIFIGLKDSSTKNLLGADPQLWQAFQLPSDWVKKALKTTGNYGEIYERNFGAGTEFETERGANRLIENGGLIKSQLFL